MRHKASRCLLVLLVLVFLVPTTPAVAGTTTAVPAVAPASVPDRAQAGPAAAPDLDIWGGVCNIVLTPLFGGAGAKAGCVAGKVVAPAAKDAISSALQSTIVKPMADGLGEFVAQMLETGLTWFLTTKSVSVESSGVTHKETGKLADGSIVTFSLQGICLVVGEMIAILLVMFAGIRAMIQRKGKPIADALQGLVINVLVTVLGITVIDSLLVASDELTNTIINIAFHGDAKLSERMVAMLLPTGFNPMALLTMAILVLLVGVVQFALLFLRQAAIPIQALLLPIAGSGQVGGERTRQWLPKLYTSIITVIAYKPMAALIISAGFVELANGSELVDWLRGVVTLVLSVVALKALMGVFASFGTSVAGATSSGFAGALSGAGALMGMGGGLSGGQSGGGGASAVTHAQNMAKQSGGNPAMMAAQAGINAVKQAKETAGNTMGNPSGPGNTKQGEGQGQARQQAGPQGDQSNGAPSATPTGTPPRSGGPGGTGGGEFSVSLRAPEAGNKGSNGQ